MHDSDFPTGRMWMFSNCPVEERVKELGDCLPARLLMSFSLNCIEYLFDNQYTSSPLNIIAESSTLSSYLNSI